MISFGAKYINTTTAQKILNDSGIKKSCKVSFVELNPKNLNDIDAVAIASENWGLPECSELISNSMERIADGRKYNPDVDKFYAITSQTSNFDALEASDMLAVCSIHNKDDVKIASMQVKPDDASFLKKPFRYNHIGTSMLNSIKKLFSGKTIELYSLPNAKKFYIANGFKEGKKGSNKFYYVA